MGHQWRHSHDGGRGDDTGTGHACRCRRNDRQAVQGNHGRRGIAGRDVVGSIFVHADLTPKYDSWIAFGFLRVVCRIWGCARGGGGSELFGCSSVLSLFNSKPGERMNRLVIVFLLVMTLLSACSSTPANTTREPVQTDAPVMPSDTAAASTETAAPLPASETPSAPTEAAPNPKLPAAPFEAETYVNEEAGFALDYPAGWTVNEKIGRAHV